MHGAKTLFIDRFEVNFEGVIVSVKGVVGERAVNIKATIADIFSNISLKASSGSVAAKVAFHQGSSCGRSSLDDRSEAPLGGHGWKQQADRLRKGGAVGSEW